MRAKKRAGMSSAVQQSTVQSHVLLLLYHSH